ncbi:MAG: 4-hydroxythreonine-4-phosphate dehydrogenase PdxA [Bacteroides sp.]|nr:4-hydroxythreonine-4-phosphate dehydrogenase PdxA [Bacteroides sp.]MCM1413839.1 4-hydroxythreonine-4-phosphate dehydrogenase PdxA [Bacteroides sp.]MCM1472398.1 4-hydroxythreonine-4-phosphate dehydrogenase PdxA [Bacteroides sp.]
MSERKLKIGITHGDINGIGYEVIIKALEDPRMTELCTPIIYGSAKIANHYTKLAQLQPLQALQIKSATDARPDQVNIINVVDETVKVDPGQPSELAGKAAFAALEAAVADLRNGAIDALVTAPINKHNIHSQEFSFPGHTEYLEASLGDGRDHALMILCNDTIRVALVTIHEPISNVARMVTRSAVLQKIEQFADSLTRDFGIGHPRIAVLALNPHSGENGLLGSEELNEISPAIADARQKRINVFGPYAADGFWGSGMFGKFDGVLAMYHDQGLAPFKTLAMNGGVNFTAGLGYVRTSPDHGTGYDIAGTGKASEESMRQAIYQAIDIVRARRNHATATANPLRKQYVEKNKKDNVVLDLTKSDDSTL